MERHRSLSIFITAKEIAHAQNYGGYGSRDQWTYIKDRFMFEHGVRVLDRSKLKLEPGPNLLTMKITGYVGNGLTVPQE